MLGYTYSKVYIILFFMSERRLREFDGDEIVMVVEDCFEQINKILCALGWCPNFKVNIERFSAAGDLNFKTTLTFMNTFATSLGAKVTGKETPCRCYLCEF